MRPAVDLVSAVGHPPSGIIGWHPRASECSQRVRWPGPSPLPRDLDEASPTKNLSPTFRDSGEDGVDDKDTCVGSGSSRELAPSAARLGRPRPGSWCTRVSQLRSVHTGDRHSAPRPYQPRTRQQRRPPQSGPLGGLGVFWGGHLGRIQQSSFGSSNASQMRFTWRRSSACSSVATSSRTLSSSTRCGSRIPFSCLRVSTRRTASSS